MTDPAWSYSTLTSLELCAKKHYHEKVLKDVPRIEGDQARWGKKVHKAFELRIKQGTPLPAELLGHEALMAKLLTAPGIVSTEQQIAITKNFIATEWFAKDVWCRTIIDLCIINGDVGVVVDYKTGRFSDDFDQLELTAAIVMTLNPHVKALACAYLWIEEARLTKTTVYRRDIAGIWTRFTERLIKYNAAYAKNQWPPTPNFLCKKWCPVTICPHHGR